MKEILKLPIFEKLVFNEKTEYGYGESNCIKRRNLKKILLEVSKGYCMYCFKKIVVDGDDSYGELEHTIEKDFGAKLKECHYNIAIACRDCNGSRKKTQQEKRRVSIKYMRCNKTKCKDSPCKKYLEIKKDYIQNMKDKNLEKIILQPFGIKDYQITFDLELLKFSFIPNDKYISEDEKYIESHISKFKLNDPDLKTKILKEVIDEIIYYEKLPPKDKKYDNLIGNLFIEYLYEKNFSTRELLEYCLEKSEELICNYE